MRFKKSGQRSTPLVAVQLSFVMTATVLSVASSGGGPTTTEDPGPSGSLIRFEPEETTGAMNLVLGDPASGPDGVAFPEYTGQFALASGWLSVAFMTPGSQGSLAEPAPGWLIVDAADPEDEPPVWMDGEHVTVWFYDEDGVSYRVSGGSITLDDFDVTPDTNTSSEAGMHDGGEFRLSVSVSDATLTLADGIERPVNGSVSASGQHEGTPIVVEEEDPGGGGGDCDSAWTGSPDDVQVSSQCAAACSYASVGNTEGKDASCSIVEGWGATGSCTACP